MPSSTDSGFLAANNVLHEPYATTPVSTISFTLSEVFTPQYKGYWDTETPTGNITETPYYIAYHNAATISGTFGAGNTVRGQTSDVAKVFVSFASGNDPDSPPLGGTNGDAIMLFETTVTNAKPTANFTPGEVLEDLTSGATVTMRTTADDSQVPTSGRWDTSLVPGTPTPTHVIAYDAQTGNFTEGDTLTGGTSGATGTICQVFDDGTTGLIWLRDVTGTFADNETITDGATGSATANGGAVSAGTGALWVPTSAIALESGTWAEKPFIRRGFMGQDITASQGAGLIDA